MNDKVKAKKESSAELKASLQKNKKPKAVKKPTLVQTNDELTILNRLAKMVTAQLSLNEACNAAVKEISVALDLDVAVLFVREGDEMHLKAVAPTSSYLQPENMQDHLVGECLCGLAARTGRLIFSHNIHKDKRCKWMECKKAGLHSFAAVPLRIGKEPVGILGIASAEKRDFKQAAHFLRTAADQLAIGIYNAGLFEQTRNYAARLAQQIAERKLAEETLRKSERKYRELVSNANSIILRWNPKGKIMFLNEFGQKFFGYSESEILGRHVVGTIVPETESTGRNLKPLMDKICAQPEDFERNINENMRSNGERVWIEWTNKVVMDEQGQIKEILSVGSDITERHQAEKALFEKTEELDRYFTLSLDLLCIADTDGYFHRLNPEWESTLGYKLSELDGKRFLDFVHPDDIEATLDAVSNLARQKEVLNFVNRYRSKDGSYRWLEWRSYPKGRMIYAAARDITDRRQAEEERRLNESRIYALIELAQMTNQPFQALTEFTLEKAIELTRSTIGYLAFLNEDETVLTMYSWSRQAMQECMIQQKPFVYPVETTGLWGEAVRQRKPVITNDYQAPNPLKKGYPEGHVHVNRHMNIPLIEGGKIVIVAGVGNKASPYDDSDIRQLTLLMDGMWKIIKHKQIEDAMRESEEKYHSLMDNASDAILLADIDGNLLEVNKKAEELLGYTKEDLVAMTYTTIHPPKDFERASAAFNEIILKGVGYLRDDVILRKDGKHVPVDITGSLIVYGDQLIIQGILRDITERKQREDDITYSLSLQKAIIESTADGILVVDTKGGIVSFNQKFMGMWRIPRQIIDSRDDNQALSFVLEQLKNPEGFINKVRELYTQPEAESFDEIEFKDGRFFERYSKPHKIGEKSIGRVWSFRDITERKRAEAEKEKHFTELRNLVSVIGNSQREWRETFDSINDLIFIIDMDSTIIRANKAIEKMTGIPIIEIIGKKCYELFHGTDSAPEWCAGVQCLKTGKPVTVEKFEPYLNMFIEISAIPRFSSNGDLVGVIHIVRDITEHRKNEEQFRQAQKMEAVGQLAGGIAHDFNNILTAIISSGQLLKMKMDKKNPLKHYVGYILDASERGAILVKGLLAFSRKDTFYPSAVNLNEIIKEIEPLLRRLVPEDIDIQETLTDSVLTVMADKTQIEQILINLVANARDAMPSGGLIGITTERAQLDENFVKIYPDFKRGEYAVATVSDTGTGMDEKTRERIFEPFFTTKEVGKGTGLGLSSAYGIIKQHNGSIHVYSKPAIGTTIKIYLPLIPVGAEGTEAEEAILPKGGDETILFAEDDSTVRDVTKNLLQEFGYTVIVAADGKEAVSMFMENKDKIRLVLLDVIMPNLNGKEAYEKMKKINPDIKTIFMSGYTADILKTRFILEDGLYYISKPAPPVQLLTLVRNILDAET